jgi:hypothetical protein
VFDVLKQRFTTVILFALHGMGRNTSQEHFMPDIMDRVNARFITGDGAAEAGQPAQRAGQRGLVRLLRERVPAGVQNAIARAVPVGVRDAVVSRQVSGGHDWARTPGLALLADLNGYLRWNLRGRERLGMLVPRAPEQVRYVERLVGELRALRVDGGDLLVSDIRFARDDYPGTRSNHLPDAIVRWTGRAPVSLVRSEGLGELRGKVGTGRGGNHRFEGFCVVMASGAGATAGLFFGGWALQFVGHYFEGRKPAFMDDLRGLLDGPLFLVAEAAFALGLSPELRAEVERRAGPTRWGAVAPSPDLAAVAS